MEQIQTVTTATGESVVPGDEGKDKFKKCDQIAFYRRQKQLAGSVRYHALLDTLEVSETHAELQLQHTHTEAHLLLQVCGIKGGAIRVKINELQPIRARYEVPDVLIGEPVTQRLRAEPGGGDAVTLSAEECGFQVRVKGHPFLLEVECEGEVLVSVNAQGRLHFETLQTPPTQGVSSVDSDKVVLHTVDPSHDAVEHLSSKWLQGRIKGSYCICSQGCMFQIRNICMETNSHFILLFQGEDSQGLWKEEFKTFLDVKANGPSSVGLDFSLHGFEHVYGIPEHADTLRLKNTRAGEPYRLYNLDVFAYEIHSRLGLYGTVPLLLGHRLGRTVGIFWLNASETLLDIGNETETESSLQGPPQKKRREVPSTELHWMSESGVIDAFVLLGPSPLDVFKQFASLTVQWAEMPVRCSDMQAHCGAGFQALPPLFSLGYHQSRWNYEDEADVLAVDAGFDQRDIPYDVIWLDIEHTDGKRYFTWDSKRFPDPARLQRHLQRWSRRLVVISDPHIKVDPDYPVYRDASEQGCFVRDRAGRVFEGSCWPGPCSYLDFTSPLVRDWYSSQFALNKYKGSTDALFVWNDMNEPSVFDGPEQTMPKDAVHCGGWEHRELHNLYGFYQHWATMEGLIRRSKGTERPFVLTRSFFAGSQRFGAVWTGDNVASWDYLKISIPMLLTLSITGISFCGADVGGFFQDPEPELLVRWYQAGALQPFFRGHSAMQTKRREPWLFGDENTRAISDAIRERYRLLPYWPLWVEFPGEIQSFEMEDEYMIGNALLACPVTDSGVTEVNVLFPGSGEVSLGVQCRQFWYDIRTFRRFEGGTNTSVPVTLDSVPVFQRGGTIVPRKTKAGRSTACLSSIPFDLTVALDSEGCAEGELYVDDGHSFNYRTKQEFTLRRFTFRNKTLSCSCADEKGQFQCVCSVERVVFLGLEAKPSAVIVQQGSGVHEKKKTFRFEEETSMLTVENLKLKTVHSWELKIK
ncbi:neutral alpha-glucosidase C isoform X3 [Acipenser ruthenus]|uniref:neutral alpha-glucosidase C isoform X3 n=1 Tax=Acipenser ruthenus TaxID=7906 RepID=UPI0027416DBB|nr:neutral alpha-glucosidase C isoform X3 [Acipenser ruthenus]